MKKIQHRSRPKKKSIRLEMNLYISGIRACVLRQFSCVRFFVTLWTVPHQAPLSMGFPRREYWSGLPFPSPGNLSDVGIKPTSLNICIGRLVLYTCATWEALSVDQAFLTPGMLHFMGLQGVRLSN